MAGLMLSGRRDVSDIARSIMNLKRGIKQGKLWQLPLEVAGFQRFDP